MGRPSKLTERQKAEIGRRLAQGESGRKLAKEFKCSEATIRANVSAQVATIQDVAVRLAHAELDMERLPISAQVSTRTLADQMKKVSVHMANAAESGAKTAEILNGIALRKAELLTDNMDMEDLRPINALAETANKSMNPAAVLLNANRGKDPEVQGTVNVYTGVPRD